MSQPLPNLHHLELFYHVAKAGGITAAVKAMPYGIQQPAVSGQIGQLEADLGVRLFQRRPFQLTDAGRELYEFASPFFGGLAGVAERVAGKADRHLRLAAPATVIRDHLPGILEAVRRDVPDLELTLLEAGQQEIQSLLEREEIHLAIAELEGKPVSGVRCEVLLSMPLVLLLGPEITTREARLKNLVGKYPLIRPVADSAVARIFSKGLMRRKLDWPARIEVSTLELVESYVARGFGVGLSVRQPGRVLPEGVRMLELSGMPELRIAALWRGKLGVLAQRVLSDLGERAKGFQ